MISTLLVANRGEIARRVFRTCRDLGIATVAVYADPDAHAPHVREADFAVRLPDAASALSYLRADLLVDAALQTGADAVHPGYGFLAESADFAHAVLSAGLTWVGPPPDALAAMGNKVRAKALAAEAGVPVLPNLAVETVTEDQLPVLIKAAAGGGGRGMRIVTDVDDLTTQVAAARAEADAAFGDRTVFCEPYLAACHHVEVQLLADRHGTVWTIGERECSIQRRHQKVVEEAPSPLVDRHPAMRERLFAAASAVARAVDYVGAGTVEFLADEEGRFFFLEMNARVQVEHPVTECTTGIDLIALQLGVAEGMSLPPDPPPARGSALEARLYAEDPIANWAPQSGTVQRLAVPGVTAQFSTAPARSGVRVDAAVEDGTVVGPQYDALLAKVIAWAPQRSGAARLLARTLRRSVIHGMRTNRDLLVRALEHTDFLAGHADTSFLDAAATLAAPLVDEDAEHFAALSAALALDAADRAAAPVLRAVPSGWRNVVSGFQVRRLDGPAGRHTVRYRHGRQNLDAPDHSFVILIDSYPDEVVLERSGVRERYQVARYDNTVYVDGPFGSVGFAVAPRFPDPAPARSAGSLTAPMPGTVVTVDVAIGDRVEAGQPVLALEAMKMQHTISAPRDGVVRQLPVRPGQQVEVGTVLAVITSAEEG